jgi:hypothetical protein
LWLPRLGSIRLSKPWLIPEESSGTRLTLVLGVLLLLGPKQTKAAATASRRLLLGGLPEYRWLLASGVCTCWI